MTSTDLHAFLRSRRSIRKFRPERIDPAIVRRILETATFAPSAHNRQPWRFAVISGDESKLHLADGMAADFARDLALDGLSEAKIAAQVERSRGRILSAPCVVVVCMDWSEMDVYPDKARRDAERIMAIQSTALAGMQLLLGAHAEGLASVWVCAPLFAQATVRSALGLPGKWEPQAMILLGYAGDHPKEKEMKAFDDVVLFV